MAKRKENAIATKTLAKANVYSVTTLLLTLGLIGLALIAMFGLPYFTFSLKNLDTNVTILERASITFEDLIEFSYVYPIYMTSGNAEGLLNSNMYVFFKDIILNIAPSYLSILVSCLFIIAGVFEVLFLIFAIVILFTSISAFKNGNFKKLRSSTRSTGIMVMLTFLPAILLNILFFFIKGNVNIEFNTFIPFIFMIMGIMVEAINSCSYKKGLKNAVANEKVDVTPNENEIASSETTTSEEENEAIDAPLEEIPEVGAYKVCPNCGKHAELDDRFCEECGESLENAIVVNKQLENQEDPCACCCGCCDETNSVTPHPVEEEVNKEVTPSNEEVKVSEEENETKIAENEDVKVVVVGENGTRVIDRNNEVGTRRVVKVIGLPVNLTELGDHRFAKNGQLQVARIPSNITELGVGCFANCYNLEEVSLPLSITKICANALFACSKLRKITYEGTIAQFKKIERQTNWLTSAGTNIISCSDGEIMIQ